MQCGYASPRDPVFSLTPFHRALFGMDQPLSLTKVARPAACLPLAYQHSWYAAVSAASSSIVAFTCGVSAWQARHYSDTVLKMLIGAAVRAPSRCNVTRQHDCRTYIHDRCVAFILHSRVLASLRVSRRRHSLQVLVMTKALFLLVVSVSSL